MSTALPANAHVSKHPCTRAKLSQLRSHTTNARETKLLIHEIATIVGCEALASCVEAVEDGTDVSPLNYEFERQTISPQRISLVPILRSGLSMTDALLAILPFPVPVHHLGLYREKSTLQPVEYYNNLPYHRPPPEELGDHSHHVEGNAAASELAIVVDPVIATGSTMCAAIETLRDWGVKRIVCISVLASEGGLRRACEEGGDGVEIWAGGVDAETDAKGMIKPGLGDVGDRLFLTLGK
ncbi:PRTase-like protein [Rhizodiscina lignyota]|uniref:uracil phosphoribosyltransferase n=1 Tax=Rhizodiscina lignyota TaxID=1504668 RepID=A0A9P4MH57_9PEZI|nr:PRTase-like protein [Rhizodiscina lignyota]